MSHILGRAQPSTLFGRQSGYSVVRQGSDLTRLHYYDGKFLRAADLELEQRYVQALVHLSNQAGGPGIVYGFSTVLGQGDTLEIGEGLAIDPQGRVLLLQGATSVPIGELLGASGRGGPIPYGDDVIVRPVSPPVFPAAPVNPPRVWQPSEGERGTLPRPLERGGGPSIPAGEIARRIEESSRRAIAGMQPQPTMMMRSYASTAGDRAASGWMLSDPAARAAREGEFADCEPHAADMPDRVMEASDLYLIVVMHAEDLCGHEDVYGRLCEAACTTRSERPYFVEGVVVRAIPLALNLSAGQAGPIVFGIRHLRSRIASAYFAREAGLIASLISKEGLASDTWCLGAEALGGYGVPIGVLARSGSTTTFFDAWIARRERMDTPPRQYWAWRMSMRPWNVFLAHVLQFQCQLHDLFMHMPGPGASDPCREGRELIDQATGALGTLKEYYEKVTGVLARMRLPDDEFARIDTVKDRVGVYGELLGKLDQARKGVTLGNRVLIRGGIVELPSAGYLPVASTSDISVNEQVRNLLGEGVDLRFCVVRPDFVPHALEEAQHMERISLVDGLANAQARPRVDILVPNGELVEQTTKANGMAFAGKVRFLTTLSLDTPSGSLAVTGAGRGELLETGGVAFHFAGVGQAPPPSEFGLFVRGFDNLNEARDRGEFGGIERGDASVPEGVFRVRDAARRIAPGRMMGFSGGTVRGTPEGIPGNVLEQPTVNKVSALWSTLRSDDDPFRLQVGQETPLNGRLVVVVPTHRVSLADITMRGALRVSDVTPSPTATDRCRGFLTLDVVWTSHLAGTTQQRHDRVEATIELERVDRAEGSSVMVKLAFTNATLSARIPITLTFEAAWAGSPVSATSESHLDFGRSSQPVLDSSFRENPDVLNAGNTEHDLAETALEVIDAVLAEPAFKAHAEQLLFPPAKAPTHEQTLRATLDWVLFHRRRDKECGGKEAVVAIKNRRYKVYAGLLKVPEQATDVLEALRRNQAAQLRRAQFVPAGVVEFGGGSPNLLTAGTTIAEQWQHVGHGNRILLAAVANQGEAVSDGQPLSLARLKQFEVALNPVGIQVDPNAVSEMLPAVPAPALPADDTDGIMAIVTYQFVNLRRARVVLYAAALRDAFTRIVNRFDRTGTEVPLPDLTVIFEDNVLVENDDAHKVLDTLQHLVARVGLTAERLDLASPDTLDTDAQRRASSMADFLRRTQFTSPAGQAYYLLAPAAAVGPRPLRAANPKESDFLNEAGREVDELIVLAYRG